MQKVLTADEMREVDRLTTEVYRIPSLLLMENAAYAVASVITERLGGSVNGKSLLILCGTGNNGGDGAALARLLLSKKARVSVLFVGDPDRTRGDARANFEILKSLDGLSQEERPRIFTTASWASARDLSGGDLDRTDVLVDAIVGTGATRGLDEWLVENILQQSENRRTKRPIRVAIDMPSGLATDSGVPFERHFVADVTVTFTAPKPSNVLPPSARANGELIVAPIGSPQRLVEEQPSKLFLAEAGDAWSWLEKSRFTHASYKNKRGHALIIAGSKNYTGAAVLAGDAAIRSGVGLVTLAVPESSRGSVVGRVQPEVMVRGMSETAKGSAAENGADELEDFLKNVDAMAVGSGMSQSEETARLIRRLVDERTMPIVVDADGLTALSPWGSNGLGGEAFAARPPLVLTPHEGEFRKMLGLDKEKIDEVLKDRVGAVRGFASKHQVILVLKGERPLIGHPDGRVVVNPTGNSGLGKAGNGDTLTGIIAGFVAQAVQMNIDMFETVVAAVYIAGLAGDIAEKRYGKRVMTASDVRGSLSEAFQQLGPRVNIGPEDSHQKVHS